MSQFIDRIQGSFTSSEPSQTDLTESIPYTHLTGDGRCRITPANTRHDVVFFTGDPPHNTFAYIYTSEAGDTIIIKELVLPVIKKQSHDVKSVIDGHVSPEVTTALRDTNNEIVNVSLTEPDSNIIDNKPYIPAPPVHENCKLISKIGSDGVQSLDVTVPIPPYGDRDLVQIRDIPVHVSTRVLRDEGTDTTFTTTQTTTSSTDSVLPVHAVDESVQNDVFKYLLDRLSEFSLQTKHAFLTSLSYTSHGVLEAHIEPLSHILYSTHNGEYAREYGDVIPVNSDTVPTLLEVLSESNAATGGVPTRPVLDAVTDITATLQQTPDTIPGSASFIEHVVYPIVMDEISEYVDVTINTPVDVTVRNDKWTVYDGVTHRLGVVLSWLPDSDGVEIGEETLRGLIAMSVNDAPVPDVFVIDVLRGRYDTVVSTNVKEKVISEYADAVETHVSTQLRGDGDTVVDEVTKAHAREAAESFESITDREIIRRDPPVGYATRHSSGTQSSTDESASGSVKSNSENDSVASSTTNGESVQSSRGETEGGEDGVDSGADVSSNNATGSDTGSVSDNTTDSDDGETKSDDEAEGEGSLSEERVSADEESASEETVTSDESGEEDTTREEGGEESSVTLGHFDEE